ncbi:MAG: nitroreductase family protein [Spirosomaceae bacterium]|jgi:nitroreductase|nr:nitroreductase family protein [Spirosomataceae bacterium]
MNYSHVTYTHSYQLSEENLLKESYSYYQKLNHRRSVRFFSDKPVSELVIQNLIMAASTAPSGANKQPWTFCAISNPEIKKQIRAAAEEEEFKSYNGRMSEEWLRDLAPLGTDWKKPFLETAPWLIVVFKRAYEYDTANKKHQNYYVNESVGLACGFLLTAIHEVGLVTLTHTPSPMDFLTKILNRPENERPFLLLPIGYPADDATVPDIQRKPAEEVVAWYK